MAFGGPDRGDDAGLPYGRSARFWVEPGRAAEFAEASDVRRAAWAWRRYVSAVRSARLRELHELRYERLTADPDGVAAELAAHLDTAADPLARGLRAARDSSVGRYRTDLTRAQLHEVQDEAGELLAELGYG